MSKIYIKETLIETIYLLDCIDKWFIKGFLINRKYNEEHSEKLNNLILKKINCLTKELELELKELENKEKEERDESEENEENEEN
jgi:hypothetical protein